MVEPVPDDNIDHYCNNRKKGDGRFDHETSSLVCAETVDLAVSVP